MAACVRGRPGAVTPLHECACADAGRAARVLAAAAAAAAISDAELWAIATGAKPASQPESAEVPAAGDPAAEDAEAAEVEWSRFLDPLHAKVGAIGSTPLHAAAECDAPAVATALLEAKADPNIGDDHGDTPVHIAMLYGSPRALAELLARGGEALRANGRSEPLGVFPPFPEAPSASIGWTRSWREAGRAPGPGGTACGLPGAESCPCTSPRSSAPAPRPATSSCRRSWSGGTTRGASGRWKAWWRSSRIEAPAPGCLRP